MRKHLSEITGPQRLVYGLLGGVTAAVLPVPMGWQFRGLLGW